MSAGRRTPTVRRLRRACSGAIHRRWPPRRRLAEPAVPPSSTRRYASATPHCRDACAVDAIVGAHQLHPRRNSSECTGCELCVAPCPVDCIHVEIRAADECAHL
ncbi:MAG: 4Fe-4S binding protein [Woeseiaceae bacterium]|nr:4Fe-4S binding protein [Woeseiaceae bacterium]